ncbi:hypothetical protein TNCV_3982501 [Trichonephila clavipes]|nr:hypothetical protein TNCV_3982501 [Trichonephila clavipes]
MGGADYSGIFNRTSKIRTQFGEIRFLFPSLRVEFLGKGVRRLPRLGGHCTPKLRGASSDFPRFRKCNEPRVVTLRWFWTN